jgi:hypothetical protein
MRSTEASPAFISNALPSIRVKIIGSKTCFGYGLKEIFDRMANPITRTARK